MSLGSKWCEKLIQVRRLYRSTLSSLTEYPPAPVGLSDNPHISHHSHGMGRPGCAERQPLQAYSFHLLPWCVSIHISCEHLIFLNVFSQFYMSRKRRRHGIKSHYFIPNSSRSSRKPRWPLFRFTKACEMLISKRPDVPQHILKLRLMKSAVQ